MSTDFWNLFWTTGMPEAWLMSRDGERPDPDRPEREAEANGPLASPVNRTSSVPGGPERLY